MVVAQAGLLLGWGVMQRFACATSLYGHPFWS